MLLWAKAVFPISKSILHLSKKRFCFSFRPTQLLGWHTLGNSTWFAMTMPPSPACMCGEPGPLPASVVPWTQVQQSPLELTSGPGEWPPAPAPSPSEGGMRGPCWLPSVYLSQHQLLPLPPRFPHLANRFLWFLFSMSLLSCCHTELHINLDS